MERLAAKASLPVPKLYVIPEPAPNAFATGRNPQHASVAVTEGLLELMNDDELEGVIAHELSHVRNYDILITSIAATLAGAITYLASMGRWAMIFGGYGGRVTIATEAAGWPRSLIIFLAPDRRADAAAFSFAHARVFRGRDRRAHGGAAVWVDQRAAKIGRVQPAHPDNECFTFDRGAVHRETVVWRRHFVVAFQHPSSARGSHRRAA